jgi:hypothetical protein
MLDNHLIKKLSTVLISESLFNKVQEIITGHDRSPVQYAGKPILFRGMITCAYCGCMITGDIKKGKYMYYSCSNLTKICCKRWISEEKLLAQMMVSIKRINFSNEQIQKIVAYLKKSFKHEQEFFKNSQQSLRNELDSLQSRISKLVDMHLDGGIDSNTYKFKLEEYKKRQREISSEMRDHVDADESCLITIKTVLGLAKRATEIYRSSNIEGKGNF